MAWPLNITGAPVGYAATGVTTVRWGSGAMVTNIAGTAVNGTTIGIVTRFNQKTLVENIKLSNGDGITTTRIQLIDGCAWDLTIRDDTNITYRPTVGSRVTVVDGLGHFGVVGTTYYAVVVESAYDTAPKQAGEFTISVENLIAITESAP